MGQRQMKRYKRVVRRSQGKIVKEYTQLLKEYSFMNRLRIAMSIIRGK